MIDVSHVEAAGDINQNRRTTAPVASSTDTIVLIIVTIILIAFVDEGIAAITESAAKQSHAGITTRRKIVTPIRPASAHAGCGTASATAVCEIPVPTRRIALHLVLWGVPTDVTQKIPVSRCGITIVLVGND